MFKNLFSFEGRIRRMEYGLSYLAYITFSVILELIGDSYIPNKNTESIVFLIFYIPMLWFLFSQGSKRCHDRGNSGWYQLIPFYFLWMIFADSDSGPNEFGDNPKGIGNFDEIDKIGEHLI